jgi:hypothetical protein
MSIATRLRLLLVPLVAMLALAGVTGVAAAPPTPASGTFTYLSSTFGPTRLDGGNVIIALSATVAYTGTFTGTSALHGTLILHPDGTANFHDVEVFTGTVNGVPGTVTFALEGSSPPTTGKVLLFDANDAVVSATDGLAGLHGVLSEVGTVPDPAVGPVGTYTGQVQFGSP